MSSKSSKSSVFQNRNFVNLFLGTTISTLGDSAYFVLLGWFVVDITNSEGALGTALLCSSLPRLIFMLFGGVAADRISRKTILIFSLAARMVVLATFAFLILGGVDKSDIYMIYGMGVLFGFVDAFFWPARGSILPQVVSKEELSSANSLLSTVQQLSMVLGPLLGAGLLYLHQYWIMYLTLSVLFLISVFFIVSMRATQDSAASSKPTAKKSVFRELGDGIRYVKNIKVLTLIMILSLFFNVMIMGPLNIGLPVMVKHLGWNGSQFGFLSVALGTGAILGGLGIGLINGMRGRFHIIPWFVVLMGLSFGAMFAMTHFPYGLSMMFVTGVMMAVINIPIMTYTQTIVESEYLGRVTGLQTFMAIGLNPVSYAVSSYILQQGVISASTLFLIGGLSVAVLGLITVSIPDFRHAEEHPAWAAVHGGKRSKVKAEETAAL
ncbi:MAG: MFS transporter [Tumebacillaceae bacterium]